MNSYSFVIPSNRSYTSIEPLLLSITKQTYTATAVIIVRDHASTLSERNEYRSQVEQLCIDTNSKVTIVSIHNDSNFHVGKGASYVRNYGRKVVQTPSMIFVDDDNSFEHDFAEKLAKQRDDHPDAIIVPTQYQGQSSEIRQNVVADGFSYRMCRPKRITTEEIERIKEWKNERLLSDSNSLSLNPSISHLSHHSLRDSLIPITFASSNCLSWPTAVFAKYPFDESIPFSYEDIIMTWQMSTGGVSLFLDTTIPIYHYHYNRSKAALFYIDTPLRAYYKSKHRILLVQTIAQRRSDRFLFWSIGLVGQMGWLIMLIILYCPVRDRRWCISGVLKGTRDGMQVVIHHKC